MKRIVKRMTALIISLAMALSLLSANVWAAEMDLISEQSLTTQSDSKNTGDEVPLFDGEVAVEDVPDASPKADPECVDILSKSLPESGSNQVYYSLKDNNNRDEQITATKNNNSDNQNTEKKIGLYPAKEVLKGKKLIKTNRIGLYIVVDSGALATQSVTGYENENRIYHYIKDNLGLNDAAACGVLANLQIESDGAFSPTAYNPDEGAWGIMQWEGSRLVSLQNKYPSSWQTLDSQLAFMKWEMGGGDSGGAATYNYIKAVNNNADGAYGAGSFWAQKFERCSHFWCNTHGGNMSRCCNQAIDQYVQRGNLARDKYWPEYSKNTLPQMSISGVAMPSTISLGSNVTLNGTITANGKITWVWIGVRPKGEYDTIISCEANPLATSYNISSIAKQLKFNTLESGEYTLCIEGITGDKYFTVYKKDFTVSVPPTKPSVSIDRKSSVTGESVTISWNKTQNAKSYIVDGWLNDKEIIWNNVGDKTSFSYTPTVEGVHSFFVIAVNGDLTATSDGVSCTVEKSVTPQAPVLKAAKESVSIGETITLSWNKTQNAKSYIIDGWLNDKEIIWNNVGDVASFSYVPNNEGKHSFFVIAVNGDKSSTSKGVSVTVSRNNPEPAVHTHTWDNGRITKQPTYTDEGIKTYTCTVCHQARAEAIPKLPKKDNTITASNIVKGYSARAQSFNLNARADGAPLSYKSNNKKVTVKNGKVTLPAKFSGTAKITITAAATKEYNVATKTITVAVPTVTNVTKATAGKGQMIVEWKKNTTGKGYEVQYSTDKKFKKGNKMVKVGKNSALKTTIKKLKKKTYYVRIRTVNGKCYSAWSKSKTVKITK